MRATGTLQHLSLSDSRLQGVQLEFIEPVIRQAMAVLESMAGWQVECRDLGVKDNFAPTYEVSGVIGLSGKVAGTIVVSFSREMACRLYSALVGEETTTFDEEVADTVAEMANMIAGRMTSDLSAYEVELGLPTVISGESQMIGYPRNSVPVVADLATEAGSIALEIGMALDAE